MLVAKVPVPVALAYCRDHPSRETSEPPRLNSSTKSLVNGAPVLPPPPYTWLITTVPGAAAAGDEESTATPAAATAAAVRAANARDRARMTGSVGPEDRSISY
ncbi:hypothetical protein GCM10007964_39500 [Sphaerisporangium melleum]|uniref:Uncharacterized protein n=1 Tax=Sphaerisporangium melleum TaxID=321316 RepID=A0A917R6Z7_9ACTN|nr:hypothetical protein GCM10007964_39500 [Sphaerisporangium melleum]